MIKIAVCDDEAVMCECLERKVSAILERWKETFKITCFKDSSALLCSPLDFSLIFLDIQMPGMDGISLARKLRQQEKDCALIFVTVLKECMLDAFEVEAADYICKPIDDVRLEKALKRVLKQRAREAEKRLFIRKGDGHSQVKISRIYYCEVINRKIYIYTQDGVTDYYGKMEELEKQLDYRFVKCHRSYVVNLDYLSEYKDGEIILENGSCIPVSRLRRQELMDAMLIYMERGD